MNAPETAVTSGAMIRTLGGIAMLSGFLVVLVHQLTFDRIAENKRIAIERSVFEVIPGAVARKDFLIGSEGVQPADAPGATGPRVFAGYDAKGSLLGIAAEGAAPGYAEVVRVLYGYSPECQCITGIRVVESKETPGLGDKAESDPGFLANFRALDARLNQDSTALAHPIVTVKHGTKSEEWQIDAISGATVTSKAVGRGINQSAQLLLPSLVRDIEVLRSAP